MAARSILSRLSSPIYFVELANLHFVSSLARRFRVIADQPGNIPPCESLNTTNNLSKIGYRLTTAPPANHTREPDRHPVQPNLTPLQNIKQVNNNSRTGNIQPPALSGRLTSAFRNHYCVKVTIIREKLLQKRSIMPQLSFVTLDVFGKCNNFLFSLSLAQCTCV